MSTYTAKKETSLVDDGVVTPAEAALFLGVSRQMIYKMLVKGELAYSRVGTAPRIPRRVLQEYLARTLVVRDTRGRK